MGWEAGERRESTYVVPRHMREASPSHGTGGERRCAFPPDSILVSASSSACLSEIQPGEWEGHADFRQVEHCILAYGFLPAPG